MFPRELKEGDEGKDVLWLQALLVAMNLAHHLEANGCFGDKTTAGVKAFQARHELDPTGIFDAETQEVMLVACHVVVAELEPAA